MDPINSNNLGTLRTLFQEQKEIFPGIWKHLSFKDLLQARGTSKAFNTMLTTLELWDSIGQSTCSSQEKKSFKALLYRKFFENNAVTSEIMKLQPSGNNQPGVKIPVVIGEKVGLFNVTTQELESFLPCIPSTQNFPFLAYGTKVGVVEENEKTIFIYDYISQLANRINLHFDGLNKIVQVDYIFIAAGDYGEKEAFDMESGSLLWMMDKNGTKILSPEDYNSTENEKDWGLFFVNKNCLICMKNTKGKKPKVYNLADGSYRDTITMECQNKNILSFGLDNEQLYVMKKLESFQENVDHNNQIDVYNIPSEETQGELKFSFLIFKDHLQKNEPFYIDGQFLIYKGSFLKVDPKNPTSKYLSTLISRYFIVDLKGRKRGYQLPGDSKKGEISSLHEIKIHNNFIFGIGMFEQEPTNSYLFIWDKKTGKLIDNKFLNPTSNPQDFQLLSIENKIIIKHQEMLTVIDLSRRY